MSRARVHYIKTTFDAEFSGSLNLLLVIIDSVSKTKGIAVGGRIKEVNIKYKIDIKCSVLGLAI